MNKITGGNYTGAKIKIGFDGRLKMSYKGRTALLAPSIKKVQSLGKTGSTWLVEIHFKSGKKSVAEVNGKTYKAIMSQAINASRGEDLPPANSTSNIKQLLVAILLVFFLFWFLSSVLSADDNTGSQPRPKEEKVYSWASLSDKQVKALKKGDSTNLPKAKVYIYSTSGQGDSYTGYGNITGLVYNNTASDLSYVQVSIGLYSGNTKIGACLTNTTHVASGTNWSFNAYCSPWVDKLKYKIEAVSYW